MTLSREPEPTYVVIEVLEAAALELDDAAAWYEARSRGFGTRFLDELHDTFVLIAQMPLAGSPWLLAGIPEGTRHVPLHTFPQFGGLCHRSTLGRHRGGPREPRPGVLDRPSE